MTNMIQVCSNFIKPEYFLKKLDTMRLQITERQGAKCVLDLPGRQATLGLGFKV